MDALTMAPRFWAAVADCLVAFHNVGACEAKERVASLWLALPTDVDSEGFADLIYHAEPWQIACNLAGSDLPVSPQQQAYRALLARNGLTAVS